MFTLWEILLDHFEVIHEGKCSDYLAKRHPTEKLVEDFAYEFSHCAGLSREDYWLLLDHFKKHADLVERLSYARVFSESDAVALMESFPLASEFKCREVDLSKSPYAKTRGDLFEVWRQDDNGNEFLVSTFSNDHEAHLLRT